DMIFHMLDATRNKRQDIYRKLIIYFIKKINEKPILNLVQRTKFCEKVGSILDLLTVTPRETKKDKRLRKSGNLIKFTFNKKNYPLEPESLFYDWLYLNVLFSDRNLDLREKFFESKFEAFSDIEFNAKKSLS